MIYESIDLSEVSRLLASYHVRYVVVGQLEREKYTRLHEDFFQILGTRVFTSGATHIYRIR
jgi:uncharacterized membrane protein